MATKALALWARGDLVSSRVGRQEIDAPVPPMEARTSMDASLMLRSGSDLILNSRKGMACLQLPFIYSLDRSCTRNDMLIPEALQDGIVSFLVTSKFCRAPKALARIFGICHDGSRNEYRYCPGITKITQGSTGIHPFYFACILGRGYGCKQFEGGQGSHFSESKQNLPV
jgi:hypothetical protein